MLQSAHQGNAIWKVICWRVDDELTLIVGWVALWFSSAVHTSIPNKEPYSFVFFDLESNTGGCGSELHWRQYVMSLSMTYYALLSISSTQDVAKVTKRVKIRNRYNQAQHLTQDTNGKVTTSQRDFTYESQELSPFPSRWPQGINKQTCMKA